VTAPAPGDEIVADAGVVFDRTRELAATAEEIWPWLLQLGKRRAGWYLPVALERVLPRGRRAHRVIDPRWQGLAIGEAIPDYGGRDATLVVVLLEPSRALVYRSERHGALFSWALLLEPVSERRTRVHLRFRGRVRSSGWRLRLIRAAGGFFDWATSMLMLHGLEERVRAAATDDLPLADPS
jgi:hypothetical protein